MIPVEQPQLWRSADHPGGPQRGDCLRACIASILEVDYDAIPDFGGLSGTVNAWLQNTAPGVTAPYRMLGDSWKEPETLDSWRTWPDRHFENGYWIATIYSHRIPDVEEFGCGCGGDPSCKWCGGRPESRSMGITWGLHAVVMFGGRLAWDPHPERTGKVGPFRGAMIFRLEDPAPAFRALRDGREELRDAA